MNMYRQMLEQVRDLKIKSDELPLISYDMETDLLAQPIVLERNHLIHLLKRYKQERLSQQDLFDWIHFVWFSDFFTCSPEGADSIASVISVLEELEEEGDLEVEDIDDCLHALENNSITESFLQDDSIRF